MGEGNNIFSVCSHLRGGGYPVPGLWVGGYPIRSLGVGTPSQVWVGGYPITGLGEGVPPLQVWMVGCQGYPATTRTGWGTPYPGWMVGGLDGGGYPPHFQDWMGYPPPPGLDGVPPPRLDGGGTKGTYHHQDWMGYPHHPGLDGGGYSGYPPPPIRQSSIAST